MKKKSAILLGILMASFTLAHAEPKIIRVSETAASKEGKPAIKFPVAGLIDMSDPMVEPGTGCQQFIGQVKVEGVQFSTSDTVLESFSFTNPRGYRWSIPTGIGGLPNADRSAASSFIRVGKKYLVHAKICGSGGYPELVSMYDLSMQFKP